MLAKFFQLAKYPNLSAEDLQRNLRAHILDGSFFGFAMSLISVNTIMPVFIQQVGGNSVAISSVPVLWWLGVNLPQALFVRFTHRGTQAKPFLLRYGLLHRFSFLAIAVFTIAASSRLRSSWLVVSLLVMIFLSAVSGSMALPPWFQVFTKTTPVKIRGRLIALRQILSSAFGILGGSLVAVILATIPTPVNFAILFVIAFVFGLLSYLCLRMLREPHSKEFVPITQGLVIHARKILTTNRRIRDVIIVDVLILMSMTAAAFYAVYALEKFSLPASYAGTFTVLVMASMVLGNVVFGFLADHFGHRLNWLILAGCSAAASVMAIIASNILLYGLVFFFMACTATLQGISRLSLLAELCTEAERPLYIAFVNTITAPAVFVGILFGAIARWFGYASVFALAALLAAAAFLWIYFYVQEPREMGAKIA